MNYDFPDFEDTVEYYMDQGMSREEAVAKAEAKFWGDDSDDDDDDDGF